MKIETSIPPRLDGTVIVSGNDGAQYVFGLDAATGLVLCDIEHEPTLAHLLRLGTFFPADQADHERASVLVESFLEDQPTKAVEEGEEDDAEDDPVDPNALPIEGGTPPAPRRAKAKAE